MGAWGNNLIDNDEASDYLNDIGKILGIKDFRDCLESKQFTKYLIEDFHFNRRRILAITVSTYSQTMILVYIGIVKMFDLEFGSDIELFKNALENEYKRTDNAERIRYLKALDFAINQNSFYDFNKIVIPHKDKR